MVVVAAAIAAGGPARAEARAYQVRRRAIFRVFCESCGKRPPDATLWEVPILESCGEGEEGQLTYEAAFRDGIEGLMAAIGPVNGRAAGPVGTGRAR